MSGHVTTLAEWVQMVSLAVGIYAAASAPYFVLVDADLADFDPRPAVRRALVSPAADRVLVEVRRACDTPRELAVAAAALLMLATINPGDAR